jgi:type IV pilus assembly protein PilQ
MKKLIIFLVVLIAASQIFAQRDQEKTLSQVVNPDELITISENLSFDQALTILNKISEKTTGKKIVSTFSSSQPIGVQIDKTPYKKALTIIVQYNGYVYDEGEDVIVVKRRESGTEEKKVDATFADINTREVKIACVFFEADVGKMRQLGINWTFLLSGKDKSFGGEIRTFLEQSQEQTSATQQKQQERKADLSATSHFNAGDFVGDAAATLRAFETENLGEIIASPNVIVRNNIKGRIQIGSDFSIKTRDFSGNIIDRFFSTGSIIEVTPHIYNQDGIDYVLLDLMVDRSSAIPSEISTEIKRTNATTQILMLNNEETILGGLYVNDEQIERTGIPFLKDLPWWVFGLRYIFGSDQVTVTKKEVVILIKVELLPTLKERVNITKKDQDKIQEEIDSHKAKIQLYRSNYPSNGNDK